MPIYGKLIAWATDDNLSGTAQASTLKRSCKTFIRLGALILIPGMLVNFLFGAALAGPLIGAAFAGVVAIVGSLYLAVITWIIQDIGKRQIIS